MALLDHTDQNGRLHPDVLRRGITAVQQTLAGHALDTYAEALARVNSWTAGCTQDELEEMLDALNERLVQREAAKGRAA